jgi:hypothetical protein
MPTRSFNIFSEKVVVYVGESFVWEADESALQDGAITVSSPNWPLVPASYTLDSETPTESAQVPGTASAPSAYSFACNPPAPNVTGQTLIIARQYVSSLCTDVNIQPGDHFIWHNTGTQGVSIASAGGEDCYWPLSQETYDLESGDWVAVKVPSDATEGSCGITVTYADRTQPCMEMATQPKLNVGGGMGGS